MTLRPGEIVNNRYQVISALGQGGFGAVYRAEDLSLKTLCALKENLDYWDEAQRQFEREALILAGLRHPNMPRVMDYFILPAQGQYLVMDYVEGYDLQQVLDRTRKPLFERQALAWMDQICDALNYLHSQQPPVVHRDVKPANIRVTPAGVAMLVDFGVAKFFTPDVQTTIGARAVTPGYSPIEQYGQGVTDGRTDIYSLGATLYTLLTTQRPLEAVERVTGKQMPTPRQLNPEIHPQVEQVIGHAMEVLAANRFATVNELRLALHLAPRRPRPAAGSSVSQRLPASPVAPSEPLPRLNTAQLVEPPIQPNAPPLSRSIVPRPAPPSRRSAVATTWITIPEGEFIFGADRQRLTLPAFQIARFPVTNQQYRLFLLDNPTVEAPPHWKGQAFPMGKAAHPVVQVSYRDAQAFCRWLGCRLPSREEWEKAARGCDGRSYPWGEDWLDGRFCNNWDARSGGTSAVDKYPAGASPYGVLDMSGNTWEWTATAYQGPFLHEIRGGSWRSFGHQVVRVTQADGLTLDDRRDDVGFRCAK